jgi:FkbM family methyltransferase
MVGGLLSDEQLRWLYDHAPVARHEIRKLIRGGVGVRDVAYRGLTWRCHPRDNSVERALWLYGITEEEEEIDWLQGRLKPDQVFCDIGANCGIYALSLRAATRARVVAIEPNPVMRARLEENMRLNALDGVALEAAAVGDSEGKVTLRMGSRWDYGQASVLGQADHEGVEVDQRPLSDILRRLAGGRCDALKIDIEGFEDRALAPFLTNAADEALPASLVIEHLHDTLWRTDLAALAQSRGYNLVNRTQNNLLLAR